MYDVALAAGEGAAWHQNDVLPPVDLRSLLMASQGLHTVARGHWLPRQRTNHLQDWMASLQISVPVCS